MIVQSGPSLARRMGQWIMFAVLGLVIVGVVLVGLFVYLAYNPCACSPSPPPTEAPTAWYVQRGV